MITFPSVLEYRLEPFQLLDPTLPGYYRTIKMYLIDPHCRVFDLECAAAAASLGTGSGEGPWHSRIASRTSK